MASEDGDSAFSSGVETPKKHKSTKRKKTRRKLSKGRQKKLSSSQTISLGSSYSGGSLIRKRGASEMDLSEMPSKYQRITSFENITTANLRQQGIEQKKQEKALEEKKKAALLNELNFLKSGGNLLNYDRFSSSTEKLTDDVPKASSSRKNRKRPIKRSHAETFGGDSDYASGNENHVAVVSSTPYPSFSLDASVENITLPSVLSSSNSTLDEQAIAQAAKDAEISQRIIQLQKANLWSLKKIPRIPEPPRPKTHWDYVIEEAIWMATDFRMERKVKIAHAKRISRVIAKKHQQLQLQQERVLKEEKLQIRKVASDIANSVLEFWNKIEILVKHKHESKLEEKVLEARGKQLDFLVGQTERYSNKLAKDLRTSQSSQASLEASQGSLEDSQPSIASPADIGISSPVEPKLNDKSEDTSMDTDGENGTVEEPDNTTNNGRKEIITKAAEYATKHQPTGTTLSTTSIKTKVPFLLRGTLREYQQIGLDWMVSMYEAKLNGILADEMGLGKTIMTISLLAHLACDRGIWGPHLIVVPTSVMLNWEREFKRWCPAFKILTYYGSQKTRRQKRQGWSKPNAFHICITSYNLITQDKMILSRKKWVYMILDEAQNIKNFRSQRWQVLLNFNTKRRLLLTGTPLQNNLMELWSLMHFLMPHIFQSHSDFKDWFSNPVNSMIEGTSSVNEHLIARLHSVLRPFILRRMKKDVETQLPNKFEHIVPCTLSKRQRFLYDEFMSRSETKDVLSSGNYLGVLNVLMQLRKVCNHPDLFEVRPIHSPFNQEPIHIVYPSLLWRVDQIHPMDSLSLENFDFDLLKAENLVSYQPTLISEIFVNSETLLEFWKSFFTPSQSSKEINNSLYIYKQRQEQRELKDLEMRISHFCYLNKLRSSHKPIYGSNLRELVTIRKRIIDRIHELGSNPRKYFEYPNHLLSAVLTLQQRIESLYLIIETFSCYIPSIFTNSIIPVTRFPSSVEIKNQLQTHNIQEFLKPIKTVLHPVTIRRHLAFPEKRLIQYDCGKLQKLAILLRNLKRDNHRVLIFTQMTRVLDILEIFLNLHGYTYLRLDGATKPEKRQAQMEWFNADPKIFAFILSTRSGGFGINLVGADTVVFYDSDWNPAMDQQAQDRCHRIGQTREVHIYRLISEKTIEENILKKANQKRMLDAVAIEGGKFTTEFFQHVDISSLVSSQTPSIQNISKEQLEKAMTEVEDESDVIAMREAQKELDADIDEFCEEPSKSLAELEPVDEETEMIMKRLTAIQRYAYRFLEEVTPVVNTEEMDALHNLVEDQAKQWERDTLKRIEEEERKSPGDNEILYYEVSGTALDACRDFLETEMEIYGPPVPPPSTSYPIYLSSIIPDPYIHPLDSDPLHFDDSLFCEFPDLFDFSSVTPAQSTSSVPPSSKELQKQLSNQLKDRKRKKSDTTISTTLDHPSVKPIQPSSTSTKSNDRKNRKPEGDSSSSSSRKKSGQEGLFSARYNRKSVSSRTGRNKRPLHDDPKGTFVAPWTTEENQLLLNNVTPLAFNWDIIADVLNSSHLGKAHHRTAAQCANQYHNHLCPKTTKKSSTQKSLKSSQTAIPSPSLATPEPIELQAESKISHLTQELRTLVKLIVNFQEHSRIDVPPSSVQAVHPSHSLAISAAGLSPLVRTPKEVLEFQRNQSSNTPDPNLVQSMHRQPMHSSQRSQSIAHIPVATHVASPLASMSPTNPNPNPNPYISRLTPTPDTNSPRMVPLSSGRSMNVNQGLPGSTGVHVTQHYPVNSSNTKGVQQTGPPVRTMGHSMHSVEFTNRTPQHVNFLSTSYTRSSGAPPSGSPPYVPYNPMFNTPGAHLSPQVPNTSPTPQSPHPSNNNK